MTMQRRHFELIAEVLRATRSEFEGAASLTPKYVLARTVENFAKKLYATNPNFNRDRFLRACGVEE